MKLWDYAHAAKGYPGKLLKERTEQGYSLLHEKIVVAKINQEGSEAVKVCLSREMVRFCPYGWEEETLRKPFYTVTVDENTVHDPEFGQVLKSAWVQFNTPYYFQLALHKMAQIIGLSFDADIEYAESKESSPITEKLGLEQDEFVPIDEFLGMYWLTKQRVVLYMEEIQWAADFLEVEFETLLQVVGIHEAAHAVIHLGKDVDGFSFDIPGYSKVDWATHPSPLLETWVQLLCHHCFRDRPDLMDCFLKLNARTPGAYQHWEDFLDVPLERIRAVLIEMRHGRVQPVFHTFQRLIL